MSKQQHKPIRVWGFGTITDNCLIFVLLRTPEDGTWGNPGTRRILAFEGNRDHQKLQLGYIWLPGMLLC